MTKQQWLDRLQDHGSISTRIGAACELVRYLDDSGVVDGLCRIAATTQSRKLRKAIVMTLRYNPGKSAGNWLISQSTTPPPPADGRRFSC